MKRRVTDGEQPCATFSIALNLSFIFLKQSPLKTQNKSLKRDPTDAFRSITFLANVIFGVCRGRKAFGLVETQTKSLLRTFSGETDTLDEKKKKKKTAALIPAMLQLQDGGAAATTT